MVENGNIIKKVYFPREILPMSICISEAVTFLISTIIIVAFVLKTNVIADRETLKSKIGEKMKATKVRSHNYRKK